MNLGKQLQYFRKQKNITQEALAGAMGVSTKAVSKWEKDLLLPDISTLCKLSDFFGVSMDRLAGRPTKGEFMVCDADPLARQSIETILKQDGYRCTCTCESETQLFANMKKFLPHIVFLDAHLQEKNGLTILRHIKKTYKTVKVIIVTADISKETQKFAVKYGADAYITKPFVPSHILQASKQVL